MNKCYCTHDWILHLMGNDVCHSCECVEYHENWDNCFSEDNNREKRAWLKANKKKRVGKMSKLSKKEQEIIISKWKEI
jgi:hypothetical protein